MSYQNSHSCIPFIPDTYHDRTGCCFRCRPCLPYVIIIILCCHGERNSWCLNNSTIEGVRVRVGPTLNIQLLPVSLQILSPYRTNRQRVVNWGLAHSGSDPFNYYATVIQLNYKTTQFPDKYHNFLINTTCIKLSWDIPPVGTQCHSSEAYQYLPFPYQLGTHFDCLYKRACINRCTCIKPTLCTRKSSIYSKKGLIREFPPFRCRLTLSNEKHLKVHNPRHCWFKTERHKHTQTNCNNPQARANKAFLTNMGISFRPIGVQIRQVPLHHHAIQQSLPSFLQTAYYSRKVLVPWTHFDVSGYDFRSLSEGLFREDLLGNQLGQEVEILYHRQHIRSQLLLLW